MRQAKVLLLKNYPDAVKKIEHKWAMKLEGVNDKEGAKLLYCCGA